MNTAANKFYKYQGTGNDFVMLDGRNMEYDNLEVAKLCDRRFGIGADGLIILKGHSEYDFEMVYYNSDGRVSSMCGNGGRCAVQFAYDIGFIQKKEGVLFLAVDGMHKAEIKEQSVSLQMIDVHEIANKNKDFILNTGSPHYVSFIKDMKELDLISTAKEIRYSDEFKETGINVNFAANNGSELEIRTYERGVEDETLSCGTGVTATAISYAVISGLSIGNHTVKLKSLGGQLKVSFDKNNNGFTNIWLEGAADKVFEGMFVIEQFKSW